MHALENLEYQLKPSNRMPVLFVGHGNPMNAILDNHFSNTWKIVGSSLPEPQAIVVISAHWLTKGTRITDAPKQPIIYDMYGFPDELYNVQYNAKGDPAVAKLLQKYLAAYEAKLDSTWGLDHGTWSVLIHMAPEPKVPVLQISIDYTKSLQEIFELFTTLRKLRNKGVLFIGSGNIVHNLRAVSFIAEKPYDWALEFDALSKEAILNKHIHKLVRPSSISSAASFAVPTDDHYRPMLAAMALLDKDEVPSFFNEAIDLSSVSMTSFISQ